MLKDITGEVAVITGASRGIGRATAVALAREGVNLVLTARTEEELQEVADQCVELGVQAVVAPADATQPDDVERVKQQAHDAFGKVDILVNNAGVARYAQLVEHTVEDYDWMMDTNMKSTFLFARAFVPGMLEQKSGNVIIVSSQAGIGGFPGEAVYCATKHAQVGFAHALDGEVREHGVKVSVIAPGGVSTTFAFGTGRTEDMPALDDMTEAETVADSIVFAARQPAKNRALMIGMRPMSEKIYGGA